MWRLTFPCNRLTPFAAPHPRIAEVRHIERLPCVVGIRAASASEITHGNAKFLAGVCPHILLDEGRRKTVKAGLYRGVGGEEIACAGRGERHLEQLPGLVP